MGRAGPPVVRAVVFDMDGVLVDSKPLHLAITREVLGPAATEDDATLTREFLGRPAGDMLAVMVRRHGLPGTLSEYQARYDARVMARLAEPRTPRPGTVPLLAELRRRGCRLAVASSSEQQWVDAMLRALGLSAWFEVAIGGDAAARRKPAPDIYLLAAARLGVSPASCVAVEDSPLGVEAARAAGMTVVAFATPEVDTRRLSEAHRVIQSFQDFPFDLTDAPLRTS